MKKIKLPDPFRIRARMENKENKLMETMELLARVVDEKLYAAMFNLDMEMAYPKVLDDIWGHVDEEDYDKAKEVLYSLAVLLDDDARFILEHMVYPNRRGVYYFFEYFCEYLADARIIDYQLCEAEDDEELVDIEKIWEEEENE